VKVIEKMKRRHCHRRGYQHELKSKGTIAKKKKERVNYSLFKSLKAFNKFYFHEKSQAINKETETELE